MRRRAFLATLGALATTGLVGCSALSGSETSTPEPAASPGGDSNGGDTPTTTPAGNGTATDDGQTTITGPRDPSFEDITGEVVDTPTNLVVENHHLVDMVNDIGFVGTVHNRDAQPYTNVEVEVTMYDGDTELGAHTDRSEEDIHGLDEDETWRFFIQIDDAVVSDMSQYRIDVDGVIDEDNLTPGE